MNTRRTEEEKGRMQSLRSEGKTYKEIAQIMNISIDAVNYFFRKQYRDLHKSNPYRYVSYGNLLQRDFQAEHPNEKWVTDISYIHTKQGRLYLSVIKDLYDKLVIAYEMSQHLDNSLVVRTVKKAKSKIRKGTIIHSDQGSQYASNDYAELSKEFKFKPSMSRPATPIDNAPMESFFSILKTECIYRHKLETIQQAKQWIKWYIYFYNHERIILSTGMTPYEMRKMV